MDEEIQNAIYIVQLGRVLKYRHTKPDLYDQVSKTERRDLARYFRLEDLPNPDGNEAAADILLVHRRRVEAADPGIRERVAFIIDQLLESEDAFEL